jgi:hypothetical protein
LGKKTKHCKTNIIFIYLFTDDTLVVTSKKPELPSVLFGMSKKTVRSIAKNPEVVNPNRYLTQSPWI